MEADARFLRYATEAALAMYGPVTAQRFSGAPIA
jgi:hypothetical protein